MLRARSFLFFMMAAAVSSCNLAIKPGELTGKWKYVRLENVDHSPDSTTVADLALYTPYIEFTDKHELTMMWDGKVLSHGKFKVDANKVLYTESLPGGTTREFPLTFSKQTPQEIIFETRGREGTRVTARKE